MAEARKGRERGVGVRKGEGTGKDAEKKNL